MNSSTKQVYLTLLHESMCKVDPMFEHAQLFIRDEIENYK